MYNTFHRNNTYIKNTNNKDILNLTVQHFGSYSDCMLLSRFSSVWLFATQWTVACKAPLSMGFSRQEYYSGLPCPPPGDLPDPRDRTCVSCIAGGFFTTEPSRKPKSPRGLVKTDCRTSSLGLLIQSFWGRGQGCTNPTGSRWGWCCWAREHMLKIIAKCILILSSQDLKPMKVKHLI